MKNSKSNIWKIALVALIAAFIGAGAGYWAFSHFGGGTTSNSSPSTASYGKAGTTKVDNVTVKSNTQMTSAFKKVKGSVVSVVNYQKQQQNNGNDINSMLGQFGDDSKKSQSALQESSEGSGLIYSKKDGSDYVVTNNHVVKGSDKLEVILSNGTKVDAKKVGTDAATDLAVLSIPDNKANTTADFGNSDAINPGEPVIAIGSPLGSKYATSVTQGIISAKKRTIDTTDEKSGQTTGQATVIQTDAAINPGNSGGPLVNAAGQVVGINSMKLASNNGSSVEGMGFAIPSNEVVNIINQLVNKGKVVRPQLGVKVADLDQVPSSQQRSILKLPTDVNKGVLVASVNGGSVAQRAGLKKYDVIVGLDNKPINSVADLHTALYNHSVGDTVKVNYYRNGQKQTATIKLTQTD